MDALDVGGVHVDLATGTDRAAQGQPRGVELERCVSLVRTVVCALEAVGADARRHERGECAQDAAFVQRLRGVDLLGQPCVRRALRDSAVGDARIEPGVEVGGQRAQEGGVPAQRVDHVGLGKSEPGLTCGSGSPRAPA